MVRNTSVSLNISANIKGKKSRIWVCGFSNTTERDWCGAHMAFHTEKEARKHLDECFEEERCDMYDEVNLIG